NPGERAHDADGRDLADGAIVPVRDIDIVLPVDGHAEREIERRGVAHAVGVTTHERCSGKSAREAGRRDPADRAAAGIGDEHVARAVEGDALREIERRRALRPVAMPWVSAMPASVLTVPAPLTIVIFRMVWLN